MGAATGGSSELMAGAAGAGGAPATGGLTAAGGSPGAGAGSDLGGSPATGGNQAQAGSPASGGVSPSGGSSGGTTPTGGTSSGGSSAECTDVAPQGVSCEQWKAWNQCGSEWFLTNHYCERTCGVCGTEASGGAGAGGTASGGAPTGGAASGGASTGGSSSGGAPSGGASTGGSSSGGTTTGGSSATGGSGGSSSCTTDPTVYNGRVTYYTLTSTPACHYQGNLPQYYAAMNEQDYNNAQACGACVEVTNKDNNQKVTVLIVDECPVAGNEQWCYNGSHHIDLNQAAYNAIGANNNPSVSWRYVSCNTSGNIQYVWESSASTGWLALTIRNHTNPIKSVELKSSSSSYVSLSRADYNVWSTTTNIGSGPYTIRVTDLYGNVIEDTISLSPGQTITGTKQFPACK